MEIVDISIAAAILISVIVGFVRGFIKEAVSIGSLLIAIWAALYFGPPVGNVAESWLTSENAQNWFGRILVFAVILSLGGILGWGLSKLVRLSVLSGVDRGLGSLFGLGRGVLLIGVFVLGGQFAGFANDGWWSESKLIPYFEEVADWIRVMGPQGWDIIVPDEPAEGTPVELPSVVAPPLGT
ncbi:MAG: CvpA family protein [Woeseiaceae bacterium]|nr:CvpA family protein [Woeseiaceae bacterium]